MPWLVSLERTTTPKQVFLRSYFVGFLFFAGTIWWVGCVTVIGTILLVAYLALYFGAWGWFARCVIASPTTSSGRTGEGGTPRNDVVWILPAGWAALEFLRNLLLTGFGWNLLAHTQWNWTPIIQMADLTGAYGVSFLIVLVNVCLWRLLAVWRPSSRRETAWVVPGTALLSVAIALAYGLARIRQVEGLLSDERQPSFRAAVVQGNIPQNQKWDEAFEEAVWKRYESLTQEAAAQNPDLLIWPETSAPGFLEEPQVFERLQRIAQTGGRFFLAGIPSSDPVSRRIFNSAVLLTPQGWISERYEKVHLVPFGEYTPLPLFFGWLRKIVAIGDYSPGERFTVFRAPSVGTGKVAPFSVLICFEDLFPGLSRRFAEKGARWLLVITNDAWFGRSAASLQHLQASVFRAVENRVWVARAANTGWSGFVDPVGRRLAEAHQVPRFRPGFAVADLHAPQIPSFYTRRGDLFLLLCLGLAGCIIVWTWRHWISL